MKVELKPHIAGYRSTPGGLEPIEFGHWFLWVDGERLGTVPKRAGAHISLTRRLDPETEAEIKREVEAQIGERSQVTAPPEIPEDDDTDEDEDDDS